MKNFISDCFEKKDFANALASKRQLVRSFGVLDLIFLGIGAIIGAGIFVFTGVAASLYAGPAVTISFLLAAIASMLVAFCYAELSSMMPISGGAYSYTYVCLGKLPAFIIAGMMCLVCILGPASIANGWSSYFVPFLKNLGITFPAILSDTAGKVITDDTGAEITTLFDLPAFLIVMAVTYILYIGAKASSKVNMTIVSLKLIILLLFCIFGAFKVDISNWDPFIPINTGEFGKFGISGIVAASSILLLSYNGFDAVCAAAQETKSPKKVLPMGILGSLIMCTIFYASTSLIITGMVNYKDLTEVNSMSLVIDRMDIPQVSIFIKLGVIIGLISVIIVIPYSLIRILYVVATDRLLPLFFSKCHTKYNTPHRLTVVIGLAIAFIAALFPLEEVVSLASFGALITYISVCTCTIIMRYRFPDVKREFVCPLFPIIPILGIIFCAIILYAFQAQILHYALYWISILVSLYILFIYKPSLKR